VHVTERKLVEVLTDVCEEAKKDKNGFVWLTHIGHWRAPEIVAVFQTESQREAAITAQWNMDFINSVNIALDSIKSKASAIRFDSEEKCKRLSGGNWERHLQTKQLQ
jgi:hypothetical protein